MCGALNCFAVGVGSSDLAAAMKTGRIWLRVPETILVRLDGERRAGVAAKDVVLEIVSRLGSDGANYQAIEFAGELDPFSLEDRLVISSMAVEAVPRRPSGRTTRSRQRIERGAEGIAVSRSAPIPVLVMRAKW
jgi:homoaconitase/3-isopropylmalate dehydratase large subunit